MDNREQREHWNDELGPTWVAHQERLDGMIRPHGERALERGAPAPGQVVLDVGCGCGDTSLEIGRRVGADGRVLGVDLSAPMLARAGERAAAEGLAQVGFREDDAETTALEAEDFDLVFSRFGVMFFAHPEEAFANFARVLRPGGRIAFACWQPVPVNPWIAVPAMAAAALLGPPTPADPGAPGPFSLGDPERVRGLLAGAGFGEIAVEDVRLDLSLPGGSLDEATAFFAEVGPLSGLLRERDPEGSQRDAVIAAVRSALEPFATGSGPVLGSAIWVVSARKPG
jgi:SAM-dependent methyltransferase